MGKISNAVIRGVRKALRLSLNKQRASVLVSPKCRHNVYHVYVVPVAVAEEIKGQYVATVPEPLIVDIGALVQSYLADDLENELGDTEPEGHLKAALATFDCAIVKFVHNKRRISMQIGYSAVLAQIDDDEEFYSYEDRQLTAKKVHMGPPPKVAAKQSKAKKASDEEYSIEPVLKSEPASVDSVLFLLAVLLGGKIKLSDAKTLTQRQKVSAFEYLRNTYVGKFLNGKVQAGKAPSFLQKFGIE